MSGSYTASICTQTTRPQIGCCPCIFCPKMVEGKWQEGGFAGFLNQDVYYTGLTAWWKDITPGSEALYKESYEYCSAAGVPEVDCVSYTQATNTEQSGSAFAYYPPSPYTATTVTNDYALWEYPPYSQSFWIQLSGETSFSVDGAYYEEVNDYDLTKKRCSWIVRLNPDAWKFPAWSSAQWDDGAAPRPVPSASIAAFYGHLSPANMIYKYETNGVNFTVSIPHGPGAVNGLWKYWNHKKAEFTSCNSNCFVEYFGINSCDTASLAGITSSQCNTAPPYEFVVSLAKVPTETTSCYTPALQYMRDVSTVWEISGSVPDCCTPAP